MFTPNGVAAAAAVLGGASIFTYYAGVFAYRPWRMSPQELREDWKSYKEELKNSYLEKIKAKLVGKSN